MTAPGMEVAGVGAGKFNNLDTKTCALKTTKPVKQLDLCIALRMEQDPSPGRLGVEAGPGRQGRRGTFEGRPGSRTGLVG